MKRILAVAVATIFAAVSIASCSSGSDTGSGTKSVTVYYDNGPWGKAFTSMSELSSKDIGVKLKKSYFGSDDTYQAQLNAGLKTSRGADLFVDSVGPTLEERAKAGLIAETTDIWTKAVADGDLSESLKDYFTVGDKQYCVPFNVKPMVMYYNKKVFADNGIAVPATWAEMMDAAAKIKAAGTTPFYQESEYFPETWFEILLAGANPTAYQGLATGDTAFTSSSVVSAMKAWKTLNDEGYMTKSGTTFTQGLGLMKSGEIAMAAEPTWYVGNLAEQKLELGSDYGMFPIPPVDPSLADKAPVILDVGALCVGAKGSSVKQALAYSSWSVTVPAQKIWSAKARELPINPKATPGEGLEEVNKVVANPNFQFVTALGSSLAPDLYSSVASAFTGFLAKPGSYEGALKSIKGASS